MAPKGQIDPKLSMEGTFGKMYRFQSTIYSVEGEWEYFFAHFRKGVKSFKKGLKMKFGYLEGQFLDFIEDSGVVNLLILWRTVEDRAGFGKMEACPLYKSTSCARLRTTKLSMASSLGK